MCGVLSVLVEARLRRRLPTWLDNAGHEYFSVDLAVVPGRGGVAEHNGDFREAVNLKISAHHKSARSWEWCA